MSATHAGHSDDLAERRFCVYGLGLTNRAVARALVARGREVLLVDDNDARGLRLAATELGVEQLELDPSVDSLAAALAGVDAVVPAPGLPDRHRLFELAEQADVPVLSEFDLAGAWDRRPTVAVTGTNGKTTVTMLVAAMLERSGVRCAAVGNLETPLVAAIDDPEPEVFVVEASSFRLGRSRRFVPSVGVWLNFAEDHLDVHADLDTYRRAKARIWSQQGPSDLAVANADDPIVAAEATAISGPRVQWFALQPEVHGRTVQHHLADGWLVAGGQRLIERSELWSSLDHDCANALAAAAAALDVGATVDGVRAALSEFRGLAHRVELVADADGVRWYDDSKATAPHATVAAVGSFDSVVLVAGGRNKGMDLSVLGSLTPRLRAVVGIGESAPEVLRALPEVDGRTATSMQEAVEAAAELARPGDVVLLSPACASFDWYGSYAERGEHFAELVRARAGAPT